MGEAMSVLGDNVANVNTVSFKSSRTTFQDVLAQSVSTASGAAQVGRGVTLSTVSGLFAQGSFESSSSATDMAIGGQGFFMMRAPGSSEANLYTRAGEFSFDQAGFIVNPVGNFVQGWTIDSTTGERAGTIGDMRIDKTTPPVATAQLDVIVNLDSREANEINEVRLFDSWDGRNAAAINPTDPIDAAQFEYTTAIKMYDTKGASHDITVYFDRTTEDNQWEFLVTSDPGDDKRVLDAREQLIYVPATTYDYELHKGAGALMYGILEFDTSGNIAGIEAFKVPPDGKIDPALDNNRIPLESTDTYYSFEANFTGAAANDLIKLNLGAKYSGVQDAVQQTIVSELGATASNLSGASFITSETIWADVFDTNGLQLTGDGNPPAPALGAGTDPGDDSTWPGGTTATSDRIVLTGFNNTGERVTSVYDVDTNEKIQVFLDQLTDDFGASATIDAFGRLKLTDQTPGPSGLSISSLRVLGHLDGVATDDNANPFGESSVNGDTVVNVTTSKRKIISQGQLLNSTGIAITSATTPWISIYDDDGVTQVADGDIYRFNGFNNEGTPIIDAEFTVQTAIDTTHTGTVQDLLDFLETTFDADAEIDGAGRLVLTDRVADTTTSTSSLEITSVAALTASVNSVPPAGADVFGGANPWDDQNQAVPVTGSTFLTVDGDVSGEDGSKQGTRASFGFTAEALASTQYANSSTTIFQDQNGFGSGFLQSVSVDTDGIITGNYSNGQVLKKAQVALANFSNLAGLFKQGGNLFTETTDSGAPVTGTPGTNGLGSIAPNALEQSNVDLGAEFVKLITVQRGFQANSKIITTTDEMLNDLINIKR
jgi:flagellar hook protein FlgE